MSRSLISAVAAAGSSLPKEPPVVDLPLTHAKPGRVASATLDHVGDLVVVGVDRDSKRPALAFERHRQGALLRARGAASLGVGGTGGTPRQSFPSIYKRILQQKNMDLKTSVFFRSFFLLSEDGSSTAGTGAPPRAQNR